MTKTRIKSGIFAVAMLLLTLPACKKEDTTQSFTLTGPASLHFIYGQEKEVGFSLQNVGQVEVTEYPDGWECRISGNNVIIASPSSASSGSQSGTVKLSATGTSAITRTIDVAIKIPQEITENANCFIVAQPGARYKFNPTRKGEQSTSSLSPADAVLLWTTVKDGVGHVSLEDGYILFATADGTELTEANALIAAIDGDENVLWSWHIWVTDYNPAANVNELAGQRVMDRNLGAFASSNASTDDVLKSYGLYYQWGRKDPFVGPGSWDGTAQQSMYNADSKWFSIVFEKSDSEKGTLEYATANPFNYIVGVESTAYDWLFAGRDNDLWGGVSGSKTIYDPCPRGWRVAPASIWASFTTTGQVSEEPSEFAVNGGYSYGWTFMDDNSEPVYYPAAGRRSFVKDADNFSNVVTGDPVGFYWSSSALSASESAALAFTKDRINPGAAYYPAIDTGSAEGARAGGFPVRCIAE